MRTSNIFLNLLLPAGFLLFGHWTLLFALDPNREMSQYIRDRWASEQGFPRGPVYAITQTQDGYLWVGTGAGLFRFDGWTFRQITPSSGAFNVTSVLGLVPDAEGNLWIRLQGQELLKYRDGIFERPPSDHPFPNITAMSRTRDGKLLASSQERGAITQNNGKLAMFTATTKLPRSPVISIAQTTNGEVWMGTRDAGLFQFVGSDSKPIIKGLPDPKVNCMLSGPDRDIWVGTDQGAVYWNGNELTTIELGSASRRLQVLALARDQDNNLWVGTDSRGLLRVNHTGVSSLTIGTNNKSEAVTTVFEDREHNLWVGSSTGIERLRDSAFVTYAAAEGVPSDGSLPVFADHEDRVWFPPITGGVRWLKERLRGQISLDGLDRDVVYSIGGRIGEVWLGRKRGGLTRLQFVNNTPVATTYKRADGLAQMSIYSVHLARDGAVWAGTLSGGVSRLKNGRFDTFTADQGLAANTVVSIQDGSDGTTWFATPRGISSLTNGGWKTYTSGLPSINVNCLLEDSEGLMWAGTASGLAYRQNGDFHTAAGSLAGLSEQIFGIAEDRFGFLWLATSHHVLRVSRAKLMQGRLAEGDYREFSIADGLRGVEGVKRHRSVVTDSRGRIWFSLNRGISVVDPSRLVNSATLSIAHVQSLSADGSEIELREPIRIPAGRQRITIGYTGLSLSVPERVQFRVALDGFDRGFGEAVSRREAIYTNLNPGPYRFRVLSSNQDGVWNDKEATLSFEIEPLYWQTWWFRLGVALALGLSVLILYRFRLTRITHQLSIRFEERLSERIRIAQELHDTLLQGFHSVSMQLHLAEDHLDEASPVKPRLKHVLQRMTEVIEEGRSAVQGLRLPDAASRDLGQAFSRVPQELGIGENIEFQVVIKGESLPMHPILRDEVYRIGREALTNAFRHSQAKKVEIELEYTSRHFRFRVRDNGCGIDPSVASVGREGHWGLPGMRERSERIGADLKLSSSVTAGTDVELVVPAHIAYENSTRKRPRRWLAWLRSIARNGGHK